MFVNGLILVEYDLNTHNDNVSNDKQIWGVKCNIRHNKNITSDKTSAEVYKDRKCVKQSRGIMFTLISRVFNYRLITAYLLLRVNLDKIMHALWDFDASSARTRRVSALDKHQNWSASELFCLNSQAQSKYAVVNLIHTRRKQTFLSFIMW